MRRTSQQIEHDHGLRRPASSRATIRRLNGSRPIQPAKQRQPADLHQFAISQEEGYDTDLGEGVKLSVGQKQQIGIARALIRRPAILLLDEPTSSLDTTTEQRLVQMLNRAKEGRTTFVVSHRISTVVDSDLILVMSDGQVVEQGKHEDLLKQRGVYYNLYSLYFGIQEKEPEPEPEPGADRDRKVA